MVRRRLVRRLLLLRVMVNRRHLVVLLLLLLLLVLVLLVLVLVLVLVLLVLVLVLMQLLLLMLLVLVLLVLLVVLLVLVVLVVLLVLLLRHVERGTDNVLARRQARDDMLSVAELAQRGCLQPKDIDNTLALGWQGNVEDALADVVSVAVAHERVER
jgi:predicted membrane protein